MRLACRGCLRYGRATMTSQGVEYEQDEQDSDSGQAPSGRSG